MTTDRLDTLSAAPPSQIFEFSVIPLAPACAPHPLPAAPPSPWLDPRSAPGRVPSVPPTGCPLTTLNPSAPTWRCNLECAVAGSADVDTLAADIQHGPTRHHEASNTPRGGGGQGSLHADSVDARPVHLQEQDGNLINRREISTVFGTTFSTPCLYYSQHQAQNSVPPKHLKV